MGGGLLQIVAYGNQDNYLTNNPDITYFKNNYKKHTNFSIESIECTIDGTKNFDNTITCTIPRNADLLSKIYIKIKLPSATSVITASNSSYKNWVNNIGHAIIKKIDIIIGGTLIDTNFSEWFDIWNEFTDPLHHEWNLIGKKVDSRELEEDQENSTIYYIPLNFWFTKNIGDALPLIALQNHEIKLKLELRKLSELIVTDGTSVESSGDITEIKIFGDFIYLEDQERKLFAEQEHEYLIEQVQHDIYSLNEGKNNIELELFKNPVKELIWVFRHKNRKSIVNATSSSNYSLNLKTSNTNANDYFNYSSNSINTSLGLNTYDVFKSANIELNGSHDRFSVREAPYFRQIEPLQHHSNIPQKHIYCYSFCLNPEKHQPSGTLNMSVIDSKKLILNNVISSDFELLVYAIGYNVLKISGGTSTLLYSN